MKMKKLAILLSIGAGVSFIGGGHISAASDSAGTTEKSITDTDAIQPRKEIRLADSYVRPDYVEIDRLRDTKQIIVIQKKDIEEKGYRTVSDILKDQPSISVSATGKGDIDIRGQGGEQAERNIQVLIDGAPVTTLVNHPLQSNYDLVPVEQIERIEIIPGGGTVIYGGGAAGGIINITTNLRRMDKLKNTVTAEWNTDGYRAGLNVMGKATDKLTLSAGYTKLDRDLFFVNTYRNSDYLYAGLRYDIDPSQALTFRVSRLDEESKYINNLISRNIKAYGKNYVPPVKRYPNGLDANGNRLWKYRLGYLIGDRKLNSYNLTYDKKFDARWALSGDFFCNDGYYTNIDDDDKQMNHQARGMRLRADYSYTPQDKLLIGFDLYRQTADLAYDDYKRVSGTKYRLDPLSFNYNKRTEALYLLNTMNRGKFVFTQGLRREKIAWHFDKVANNGGGDETSNRWNTGAELSVGYHYNDTGRVYARYERGYTSPDGLQISDRAYVDDVGAYRYVATNAKDEKFDLYEIGLRDKIGISTVSLTLFTSYTGNQMNRFYAMEPDANDRLRLNMRTMNLLRTKRRGLELELRQKLGKLTLEEGYAYLHGHSAWTAFGREYLDRVGGDAIDYTRSGLIKVPKHKGSLRVRYDFNRRFALGLKYTFFGSYNNFLEDAKKQDDGVMASYGLLDLDVHYKANNALEWYGGVTNIFDKRYYEYASSGMYTLIPGNSRTYFAGMRYSF